MKKCALNGCNKLARSGRFCRSKGRGNHKDRYYNLKNPRGKFAHLKDVPFTKDAVITRAERRRRRDDPILYDVNAPRALVDMDHNFEDGNE